MKWSVIIEKAIRDDGSLFFPERLTHEFLESARRTMGSYLFANQYQNEILPEGEAPFQKHWIRYFKELPREKLCFVFIDPAISTEETADYTALVAVEVDTDGNWYITQAKRARITPTEIIELIFRANTELHPRVIGIEDVAYQKALLYMLDGEMRRRGVILPVTGIRPTPDKSKETRILGLIPRFEWGRIYWAQGLHDLEMEYSQFPRGSHDDLIDALAYIEQISYKPTAKQNVLTKPSSPNDPNYERWYIQNLQKQLSEEPHENYSTTNDGEDGAGY